MPAILERLVKQLKAKGKSESAARAIAISALQKSGNLKKGSTNPNTNRVKVKSSAKKNKKRSL